MAGISVAGSSAGSRRISSPYPAATAVPITAHTAHSHFAPYSRVVAGA
ncbi:hypothetical protein AB0I77_35350 [Streptomyces sp. NPDC050619]